MTLTQYFNKIERDCFIIQHTDFLQKVAIFLPETWNEHIYLVPF